MLIITSGISFPSKNTQKVHVLDFYFKRLMLKSFIRMMHLDSENIMFCFSSA